MFDNHDRDLGTQHIYTVSAPCGSGKTFCIAQEAHKLALQGKRVLHRSANNRFNGKNS